MLWPPTLTPLLERGAGRGTAVTMRATSLQLLPTVLPVLRGECDHCPDMRPKHANMMRVSTNQQSLFDTLANQHSLFGTLELQICNYSIAEKPEAEW